MALKNSQHKYIDLKCNAKNCHINQQNQTILELAKSDLKIDNFVSNFKTIYLRRKHLIAFLCCLINPQSHKRLLNDDGNKKGICAYQEQNFSAFNSAMFFSFICCFQECSNNYKCKDFVLRCKFTEMKEASKFQWLFCCTRSQ